MNPLGNVEPANEVRTVGHGDLALPEQPLQGAFAHRMSPPRPAGFPRLAQVGDPKRSFFGHFPAHLLHVFGVVVIDGLDPSPGRLAHPVDEEGAMVDRHQGSLVPPVLEEFLRCPQPLVQDVTRVGAQAREEREIVGSGQHVDRVELDDTHDPEGLAEVVGVHRRRGAGPPEPCCGDRHPAGLCQGQPLHTRKRRRPGSSAVLVSGHIR